MGRIEMGKNTNSIDCDKLKNLVDEALSKETKESLYEWLMKSRLPRKKCKYKNSNETKTK